MTIRMAKSRSVLPVDSFLFEKSSRNFLAPPSLMARSNKTIPMRIMKMPINRGNRPGETYQTFMTPPKLSFMGMTIMLYTTKKIPNAIRMILVTKSFFLISVLSISFPCIREMVFEKRVVPRNPEPLFRSKATPIGCLTPSVEKLRFRNL